MKIVEKRIHPFQEHHFFTPIRDKVNYARVLLISIRNLLIDYGEPEVNNNCHMKLYIDKMSRLFFYKNTKYFSISFPFLVTIDEEQVVEVRTFTGLTIDNKAISSALSILNDSDFKLSPSLTDYYIQNESNEFIGISLLEELFQTEPSYIRYDIDPENENGRLHPLNHFDINYSPYGTFKLGLNEHIIKENFENTLDINTECSYLKE